MATDTGAPGFIWIPDDQIRVDQLHVLLGTLASSVNTGLANMISDMNKKVAPSVPTLAARTALFPTPAQGNRVWRSDTMREERYYGTYNATTNPGGATTAGWVTSSEPFAMAAGRATQGATVNAATGVSVNVTFPTGRFTQPPLVTVNADSSRITTSVNSITKDNCVIRCDNWSNGAATAFTIAWQAMQMTPTNASG